MRKYTVTKNLNKIFSVTLIIILVFSLLCGCVSEEDKAVAQTVSDKITELSTSEAPTQEMINDVEKEYTALTDKQKELVANYSDFEPAKELRPVEKAALVAVKEIQSYLKSESSLELNSVTVKDATQDVNPNDKVPLNNYYVTVSYSATNSFGGRLDDSYCIDVNPDFKVGTFKGSILVDMGDTMSISNEFSAKATKGETYKIDCERIMNNL